MSAFTKLIDGLRGLFRSRWETALDDEPPWDGRGLLDVLCAQVKASWERRSPTRAATLLEGGETVLMDVLVRDGLDGFVIVIRFDRSRWGHINSSTPPPYELRRWPEGPLLGTIALEGDQEALTSLLDAPTRRELPELLMGQGLRLVDSTAEVDFETVRADLPGLVHRARAGLELIKCLARARRDRRHRLIERAIDDPERAVRLHAAEVIAGSVNTFTDPEEALLAVARTGDVEVAVNVARALPHADPAGLAALVTDPFSRNTIRACAALCLCQLPSPPTGALLAALDLHPSRVVLLAPWLLSVRSQEVRDATLARLEPSLGDGAGAEMPGEEQTRLLDALREVEDEAADRILVAWRDAEQDDRLTILTGEVLVERGRPELAGASVPALSELVWRPGAPLRARAIDLLHRVDRASVPEGLLIDMFSKRDAQVWRSALALAVTHDRPDVALKLPSFLDWMEPDEVEATVGLLGQLGGRGAEAHLLALLNRTRDRGFLMSVVIALGQGGSLDAVEPLLALEERGGSLGREARLSIEQIQQRLGATGRGGLSLSAGAEAGGRLSVPAGDEGRLQLLDDE